MTEPIPDVRKCELPGALAYDDITIIVFVIYNSSAVRRQVGCALPLPMNRRSSSSNQLSVGVVLFTYAVRTRLATYG